MYVQFDTPPPLLNVYISGRTDISGTFITLSGSLPIESCGSNCVPPTAVTKGQEAGKVGLKTVPLTSGFSMSSGLIPSGSVQRLNSESHARRRD